MGSGVIDMLAEDTDGLVIIELKAGQADESAVGQIARYLAIMVNEEKSKARHTAPFIAPKIRGIIVAKDFTEGAWWAAALIPDLRLYRFKLAKLSFSEVIIPEL
jgi:RecB family endonuclease NucS